MLATCQNGKHRLGDLIDIIKKKGFYGNINSLYYEVIYMMQDKCKETILKMT